MLNLLVVAEEVRLVRRVALSERPRAARRHHQLIGPASRIALEVSASRSRQYIERGDIGVSRLHPYKLVRCTRLSPWPPWDREKREKERERDASARIGGTRLMPWPPWSFQGCTG